MHFTINSAIFDTKNNDANDLFRPKIANFPIKMRVFYTKIKYLCIVILMGRPQQQRDTAAAGLVCAFFFFFFFFFFFLKMQ
jgi:hypothetical protein